MLLLKPLLTVIPPFQLHHSLMKLVRLTLLTMLSTLFVKLLSTLPWFQQYIQVSLAILMCLRTCTMQRIKFMLTVPPTLHVLMWDDPVDFITQRREIFPKTAYSYFHASTVHAVETYCFYDNALTLVPNVEDRKSTRLNSSHQI